MRDLVRQIIANYSSTSIEGQQGDTVLVSGVERDTKRPVWIEILPRLLGDDSKVLIHFRQLAQSIRQLNHPNIALIRAVGEKGGLPYVVTQAVEKAQPLVSQLNRPGTVDSAADVAMQVGQALEHAYKKGLLHGSLAPRSILVQDDGQVKVTGFGISQMLDLLGVQARQLAGPFAAPERAAGQPPTPRADVYSLGAILYALLAGRVPQVVKGEVLPPSRFNPDVPATMDAVALKALSRDPDERYADVKSFVAALGAVSLVPVAKSAAPVTAGQRCPTCGAGDQTGRFCRKCGSRLIQPQEVTPLMSEPAADRSASADALAATGGQTGERAGSDQVTPAWPGTAAAGELTAVFPDPLPMPQVNLESLWAELASQSRNAMPTPPPMPTVDWADVPPPKNE